MTCLVAGRELMSKKGFICQLRPQSVDPKDYVRRGSPISKWDRRPWSTVFSRGVTTIPLQTTQRRGRGWHQKLTFSAMCGVIVNRGHFATVKHITTWLCNRNRHDILINMSWLWAPTMTYWENTAVLRRTYRWIRSSFRGIDGQYLPTGEARRKVFPFNSEEWWPYSPIRPTQNCCIHITIMSPFDQ